MSNTTLEQDRDQELTVGEDVRIEGTEVGAGDIDVDAVRRARDPRVETSLNGSQPDVVVTPTVADTGAPVLTDGGMDRDSLLRELRPSRPVTPAPASSEPQVLADPLTESPDLDGPTSPISLVSVPGPADIEQARRQVTEVIEEQAAQDRLAGRRAEQVAEEVLAKLEKDGMDPALVQALREGGLEDLQRAYNARRNTLDDQQRAAETALRTQASNDARADFAGGANPDQATLQARHRARLDAMERSGQYDPSVIEALRRTGPAEYERSIQSERVRLQTQLETAQRSIQTNAQSQASADFANNTQPSEETLRQRHTAGLTALRNTNSYDPAVLAALERNIEATYRGAYGERQTALSTQRTDFDNRMAELARTHAAQDAQLTAPRSPDEQRRVNEERERARAALREGVDPAVLQASQGGTTHYNAVFAQHFDAEFGRAQAGREDGRRNQVNNIERELLNGLDRNTSPQEISRRITEYARNNPGVLNQQDVERLARNSIATVQARYDHWYNHESSWLERRREDFRNLWNNVTEFVGSCLQTVYDGLRAVGRSLQTAGELIAGAARGIRDAAVGAATWVGERVQEGVEWVVEQGARVVDAVVEFARDPIGHIQRGWEAVTSFVQDRWNQVTNAVSSAWNACCNAVSTAYTWATNPENWRNLANSIGDGIRAGWNGICAAARWASNLDNWRDLGSTIWNGACDLASTCWNGICTAAEWAANPQNWVDLGASVWNGVSSAFSSAWNAVTNLDNWKAIGNAIVSGISSVAEFTGIADMARGVGNIAMGILTGDADRMWSGVRQLGSGIQRYATCLVDGAVAVGGFIKDVSDALGVTDILVGLKDVAVGVLTLDPSRIANGLGSIASGTVRLAWECTGLADAYRAVTCLGSYLYKGLTGQGWDNALLVEGLVSLGAAALSIGSIVATGGAAVAVVGGLRAVGTQVCKKLATQGFKALGKELGEQIVSKCAKVLGKEVVEKASKEAGLKAGKECAEKFGKEAAEYCAKHGLTELPQNVAKEMAERIAREQAQVAAREGTEKMLKEAGVEKIVKEQVLEALEKVSKGNLDDLVKKGAIDQQTAKAMQRALNKELCDDALKEALTKEITDKLTKDIVEKGEKAFMEGFMEGMEKSTNKHVQAALKDKVVREAFEKGAREGYEKGVREAVEKVVKKAVDDAFDEHRKKNRRRDFGDGVAEDIKMVFFTGAMVGTGFNATDLVDRDLMKGNEGPEAQRRKADEELNNDAGPQAVSLEEKKKVEADLDNDDRSGRFV